ncbi:sugar phosphate isomerase/epimerase family protein [Edaphobacter albus]|uniref:sugar phosphate isomerase/epimerase family protein n=1 Tax=Edaphobacter sp. 4G125 TaxID=2763071 RepID=UPI0016451E2E|nr:sugar phosphate isomerase/epimerase family protein [Edaphobacter sp. 4G125]QNI35745.1 sugar phosphate isomerase/epimerase [Edaphobacter sp. 4G125]
MRISRRFFLHSTAITAAVTSMRRALPAASFVASPTECTFRMAVITDEISQDFGEACETATRQMGLGWVEIRTLWGKNITLLDEKEIAEAKKILKKNQLKITNLGSPLFKVPWPHSDQADNKLGKLDRGSFDNEFGFKQQDEVLERCISLCKQLDTERIRCFDFLALKDQKPYRDAINAKLRQASEKCEKHKVILVLENEESCNTQTAEQAIEVLKAVPNRNFMLNWDPANEAAVGGQPFPQGWSLLPKDRIGHVHCKDVVRKNGSYVWSPIGGGVMDWVGQFRALAAAGYHLGVSLETHWRGPGTKEEATQKSMDGLKSALRQAEIPCSRVLQL